MFLLQFSAFFWYPGFPAKEAREDLTPTSCQDMMGLNIAIVTGLETDKQQRKWLMIKYPELRESIAALPPIAQKELLDFVGYLRYKHQIGQSGQVIRLGGLWAGVDFDVTDEDVRALRQQVTCQLVGKV